MIKYCYSEIPLSGHHRCKKKKTQLFALGGCPFYNFFFPENFGPNCDHQKIFILLYRFNGAEKAVEWWPEKTSKVL